MGDVAPVLGLVGTLALFGIILIWDRRRRRSQRRCVLVAVGRRPRLSTRPRLITGPEDLAIVKEIGDAIERAGFGRAKVLTFLGRPTMDVIIETEDLQGVARELESLLAQFPVTISNVGHHGDLRWVAKLWRHM